MVAIITSHIKYNEVVMVSFTKEDDLANMGNFNNSIIEDADLSLIENFDNTSWISPNFNLVYSHIYNDLYEDVHKLYSIPCNFVDFITILLCSNVKKRVLLTCGNKANSANNASIREISITNTTICKNTNKVSECQESDTKNAIFNNFNAYFDNSISSYTSFSFIDKDIVDISGAMNFDDQTLFINFPTHFTEIFDSEVPNKFNIFMNKFFDKHVNIFMAFNVKVHESIIIKSTIGIRFSPCIPQLSECIFNAFNARFMDMCKEINYTPNKQY